VNLKLESRISLWFPIVLFVVAIVLSSIVSVAIMATQIDGEISSDAIGEVAKQPGFILMALLMQNGMVVGLLYLWVVKKGALSWQDMGLDRPRVKHVLFGLAYGFLAVVVVVIVSLVMGLEGDTSVLPEIGGSLDLVLIAIGVVIVAPIGEEIFFRGYCFGGLRKRYEANSGVLFAALPFVYSSVFFGIVHMSPSSVAIIASGFVLALALHRTRSLTVSIVAHMFNNGLALMAVYLVG